MFEKIKIGVVCLLLVTCIAVSGCSILTPSRAHSETTQQYQESIASQGPPNRSTMAASLDSPKKKGDIPPVTYSLPRAIMPDANSDPNAATNTLASKKELSLAQVISATLSNSTEIREVSFEPEIAEQDVMERLGEFDVTAFGEANMDNSIVPTTSVSEIGKSEAALFESGFKKRDKWGTEWSASYALTHSWDDLATRAPARRYEPVLAFQLKQPLLRDGGTSVNLAGINIAKLAHRISLLDFQQKAEALTTEAIAAYWTLYQTHVDLKALQDLLERAEETLEKVRGRAEIDATDIQIMQAKVSLNTRQALVLQSQKRVKDAQDNLLRLMADPSMDLFSEVFLVPVTPPKAKSSNLSLPAQIRMALTSNPTMQQAQAQVDIANINLQVANLQKMPRLDLVASAKTQTVNRDISDAHELIEETLHKSFGIGLVMEIPVGNRVRKAEMQRRKLERFRAITEVHTISDRVTVQVKEAVRRVQTSFEEIGIQDQALMAAMAHLSALNESEAIRERLTPESLLVKLQAQESLANAQRARAQALVEYNVAMAQLEQTTGQVLTLHKLSLPSSKQQL